MRFKFYKSKPLANGLREAVVSKLHCAYQIALRYCRSHKESLPKHRKKNVTYGDKVDLAICFNSPVRFKFYKSPTPANGLRAAMEVLKRLDQRIQERAAHAIHHLPAIILDDQYTEPLKAQVNENTVPKKEVTQAMQRWRNEPLNAQKQIVTHPQESALLSTASPTPWPAKDFCFTRIKSNKRSNDACDKKQEINLTIKSNKQHGVKSAMKSVVNSVGKFSLALTKHPCGAFYINQKTYSPKHTLTYTIVHGEVQRGVCVHIQFNVVKVKYNRVAFHENPSVNFSFAVTTIYSKHGCLCVVAFAIKSSTPTFIYLYE